MTEVGVEVDPSSHLLVELSLTPYVLSTTGRNSDKKPFTEVVTDFKFLTPDKRKTQDSFSSTP